MSNFVCRRVTSLCIFFVFSDTEPTIGHGEWELPTGFPDNSAMITTTSRASTWAQTCVGVFELCTMHDDDRCGPVSEKAQGDGVRAGGGTDPQQLARDDDHTGGAVAHLLVLKLSKLHQDLCAGA